MKIYELYQKLTSLYSKQQKITSEIECNDLTKNFLILASLILISNEFESNFEPKIRNTVAIAKDFDSKKSNILETAKIKYIRISND